ncbi:MAG TPA: MFS transporter [Verrucomicrobiae bacterium]
MRKAVGYRTEYGELAVLFFFQSMATGMWMVPLTRVLSAHGLSGLRPYAYATSAVAAFVSPLIFGAMADRHASPVRVLRWLACASAVTMALGSWSIGRGWPAGVVLALTQLYAVCAAPTSSISTTIVFSRLHDAQRQFGPIRAAATFGWMCGCWLISAVGADASPWSGYSGALVWLALAGFTHLLPSVEPPPSTGQVTFRERMGWDALVLLKNPDHRVVFLTTALFSIPLAAFYPFAPQHLKQLGFERTSAWMSLGQVTEVLAMFALAGLFAQWRLKWIFAGGLAVGGLRYALCASNGRFGLLSGVTLHGLSFTLFYITAQIYLNERVDQAWRARAQALMSLMNSGVGNLIGYVGTGLWLGACTGEGNPRWTLFWGGLAVVVAGVFAYFFVAYRGRGGRLLRAKVETN